MTMSIGPRHIRGVRIINRTSGEFVRVFGFDRDAPPPAELVPYDNSPHDHYSIERLDADLADYAALNDHPAADAPAQEWAEYIWTPPAHGH